MIAEGISAIGPVEDNQLLSDLSLEFTLSEILGTSLSGGVVEDVLLEDFDHDDDFDIGVIWRGYGGESRTRIWWNNGDGVFGDDDCHELTKGGRVGEFIKVNGDEYEDLIVFDDWPGNPTFPAIIYPGNSEGVFDDSYLSNGFLPASAAQVGDFNKDGRDDIFLGSFIGKDYRVFLSEEGKPSIFDGEFLNLAGSEDNTFDIELADFNGDGLLDVVVANVSTIAGNQDKIFLNLGDGNFQESLIGNPSLETFDVTVGDIDGDGDEDIVFPVNTYIGSPGVVEILRNQHKETGNIGFIEEVFTIEDKNLLIASQLADLDNDGDLDLIVGGQLENTLLVLENDGDGNFELLLDFKIPDGITQIIVEDLNVDGLKDIVVSSHDEIYTWLNTSDPKENKVYLPILFR